MFQTFLNQYPGLVSVSGNITRVDYRKLSIDSRTINAGELFVALSGENHDGHRYVSQSIEKNAAAVVVEGNWFSEHKQDQYLASKVVVVVNDCLDFLQRLGAWRRKKFSQPVIGLTGSNGKTTTREMIAAILSQKFKVFSSQGNKNNHIGLPLMLLKLNKTHEIAIFEMGSNHPGEIAHLTELTRPTAAVVTNIGKGHIGYFNNLQAIYREKTALYDAIDKSAPIFLNMEDSFLCKYQAIERTAIKVGFAPNYDVCGQVESSDCLGCFKFRLNNEVSIQLKIPGQHNVMNALLAAAVGLYFGVDPSSVKSALEKFLPENQRMEIIQKNGNLFVNDAYNANPNSMRAAVDYLAGLENNGGKRILVLGDMLELGDFSEKEHQELGEYIAGKPIQYVFLYGPFSRFVQKGIESKNRSAQVFWCQTHDEINTHIRQIMDTRDIILFKGSRGMAMEKVLERLIEKSAS